MPINAFVAFVVERYHADQEQAIVDAITALAAQVGLGDVVPVCETHGGERIDYYWPDAVTIDEGWREATARRLQQVAYEANREPCETRVDVEDADAIHAAAAREAAVEDERCGDGELIEALIADAERDIDRSVDLVEALVARARRRDVDAIARIADSYAGGVNGFPSDPARAIEWSRCAARRGSLQQMYCLCYDSVHGELVPAEEGYRWARAAAERGHAEAMWLLGVCYSQAHGVGRDDVKAAAWVARAAAAGAEHAAPALLRALDAGDPFEQHELGLLYLTGAGVGHDPERGLALLEAAAATGHLPAMAHLALVLAGGDEASEFVTLDVTRANDLYQQLRRQLADAGELELPPGGREGPILLREWLDGRRS